MRFQVRLALFLVMLLGAEIAVAYNKEFSWQNMDAFMTGDLKSRMNKKNPTRRRYCDCSEVDPIDNYPVCASNGAMYQNACLYECARIRKPDLEMADMAFCGSETFKEFKLSEFRPHY